MKERMEKGTKKEKQNEKEGRHRKKEGRSPR